MCALFYICLLHYDIHNPARYDDDLFRGGAGKLICHQLLSYTINSWTIYNRNIVCRALTW